MGLGWGNWLTIALQCKDTCKDSYLEHQKGMINFGDLDPIFKVTRVI